MKWILGTMIALLVVPAVSLAGVINLQLSNGTVEFTPLPAGGTFTVDVVLNLEGKDGVKGFDAQLRDTAATGLLKWTKRSWGGTGNPDDGGTGPVADGAKVATKKGSFPNVVPAPGTDPAADAGTAVAIGVLASADFGNYPQADILPWVERLTISYPANWATDTYLTLENANIIYSDSSKTVALPVGTKIHITPEPASLILLALGGLFLRRRHA